MARFDFRDPYHLAVTASWPVFAAFALGLLTIINLIFAILYVASPGAIQNLPPGDAAQAFFFSLEDAGYGRLRRDGAGHLLRPRRGRRRDRQRHDLHRHLHRHSLRAVLAGLQARILFADNAVVARHNGRLTLMIRIANGRLTQLTNATAKLGVLSTGLSAEGQSYRALADLPLTRPDIPGLPADLDHRRM